MNKSQITDVVARETNVPKTTVKAVIKSCESTLVSALKGGDKVTLSGFGTFTVTHTAARVGRNPRTGEAVKINPKTNVRFRNSFEL